MRTAYFVVGYSLTSLSMAHVATSTPQLTHANGFGIDVMSAEDTNHSFFNPPSTCIHALRVDEGDLPPACLTWLAAVEADDLIPNVTEYWALNPPYWYPVVTNILNADSNTGHRSGVDTSSPASILSLARRGPADIKAWCPKCDVRKTFVMCDILEVFMNMFSITDNCPQQKRRCCDQGKSCNCVCKGEQECKLPVYDFSWNKCNCGDYSGNPDVCYIGPVEPREACALYGPH